MRPSATKRTLVGFVLVWIQNGLDPNQLQEVYVFLDFTSLCCCIIAKTPSPLVLLVLGVLSQSVAGLGRRASSFIQLHHRGLRLGGSDPHPKCFPLSSELIHCRWTFFHSEVIPTLRRRAECGPTTGGSHSSGPFVVLERRVCRMGKLQIQGQQCGSGSGCGRLDQLCTLSKVP